MCLLYRSWAWAQVGLPGSKKLSLAEQQSHFALWALMKSPLIIGADLRLITPEQIDILTNPEVVAINQDPLGVPGDLILKEGSDEVLTLCKFSFISFQTFPRFF